MFDVHPVINLLDFEEPFAKGYNILKFLCLAVFNEFFCHAHLDLVV
jgi:hypothetical protein